jgi:hypothetical protein
MTRLPLSQQEKAFRAAIKAVAKQYKIKQSWFNDDAGPFIKEYVPSPEKIYWQTFGPLQAYFPNAETMLVYKIMGYSEKQKPDVDALAQRLNIRTYEDIKALVDRYVPLQTQKDFCVDDVMEELFFE